MATTPAPVPAPTSKFDWAKALPIFEIASNVALIALGANGVVPSNTAALAATIEGGINPLIANLQSGAPKTSDLVVALGALIATINVLKANKSLDPAVLARLDEYGRAAQAALNGYLSVQTTGFDATAIGQVAAIA